MSPLPAHNTKHIPILKYPFKSSTFYLSQLDNGVANGTALWLGGQCLSLYLAHILQRSKPRLSSRRPKAIELGSGVGLTALALASLGWDVLATDIPDVVYTVLQRNISNNISNLPPNSGSIQSRELDWTVLPEDWTWQDDQVIASTTSLASPISCRLSQDGLEPPFDLIISSDTLYIPSLATPLLRTLHALCSLSVVSASTLPPPVYLCIERRDPGLTERTLAEAKEFWNFTVERVPRRKIQKAVEKGAAGWSPEDRQGIEMWKLTLPRGYGQELPIAED